MAGRSKDNLGIPNTDEPLISRVPLSTWLHYTDAEIARAANVSRERVRQIRNRLNLPSSTYNQQRGDWNRLLRLVSEDDWRSHTNAAIGETLSIPTDYVSRWRARRNKPVRPGISSLHEVTDEEWETTPRHILAEQYGLKARYINNFMRRHNKPRLKTGKGAWKQYQAQEGDSESTDET